MIKDRIYPPQNITDLPLGSLNLKNEANSIANLIRFMRDYTELHFSGNAKLSYNVQGEEDEKSYYFEKIIKVRNMIRAWSPKIGKL